MGIRGYSRENVAVQFHYLILFESLGGKGKKSTIIFTMSRDFKKIINKIINLIKIK
jgi:hypothetical protein